MTREEAIQILISCDKSPTWKFTAGLIKRAEEVAAAVVLGRTPPAITLPPNDPLTLEELREMGRDWAWIASLIPNYVVATGYYIKYPDYYSDGILIGYPGHMSRYLEYAQYGKTWLAYRRKPEEVQR